MYNIKPNTRRFTLLMSFITPVSHHDPAQSTRANITPFLRKKQVVEKPVSNVPSSGQVKALVARFPIPESVHSILSEMTAPQVLAVILMQHFIEAYATSEGLGLFAGMERYRRLEERAQFHAIRSDSIFAWWGGMAQDMQVGMPVRGDMPNQGALIGMPSALAQLVMAEIVDNSTTCVMLARLWNEAARQKDKTLTLELADVEFNTSTRTVLQVPAYSANSARHEIVREPGMWHLLNALGLRLEDLDDGVAALLYNGGDLNTSAPHDAFKLTREIRQAYPLVSLLGGSTSGFILGASNLEVSAWLNVKENTEALNQFGITPEVSAFDLLDRDELTRHTAKRVDGSPMPFGFEVLIPGTQVVVDLRLRPYATDLEVGALVAAVETFMAADGTLAGQAARGYGLSLQESIVMPDRDINALRDAYHTYLIDNAKQLRAGLLDGTLATNKVVF